MRGTPTTPMCSLEDHTHFKSIDMLGKLPLRRKQNAPIPPRGPNNRMMPLFGGEGDTQSQRNITAIVRHKPADVTHEGALRNFLQRNPIPKVPVQGGFKPGMQSGTWSQPKPLNQFLRGDRGGPLRAQLTRNPTKRQHCKSVTQKGQPLIPIFNRVTFYKTSRKTKLGSVQA